MSTSRLMWSWIMSSLLSCSLGSSIYCMVLLLNLTHILLIASGSLTILVTCFIFSSILYSSWATRLCPGFYCQLCLFVSLSLYLFVSLFVPSISLSPKPNMTLNLSACPSLFPPRSLFPDNKFLVAYLGGSNFVGLQLLYIWCLMISCQQAA